MPPVDERLPAEPAVVGGRDEIGAYGGEVRMIHFDPVWLVSNYDWLSERLLHYSDIDLRTLVPNILENWEVSEDGTTFKVGVVFSSDGTMTVMDDSVLGLGVWEKVSGNQYRFTFWEIIIQQDGTRFFARVRSTIELSDDKEHYSDSGDFQITGPDGSVIA